MSGDQNMTIRWIPVSRQTLPEAPAVCFYGYLCPYLHFRDVEIHWTDPSRATMMHQYVSQLVFEQKFDQISASRLARITGIPAKFWRPILLRFEKAGLLDMLEAQESDTGSIAFSINSQALDQYRNDETRKDELLQHSKVNRDILVFPETGETIFSSDNNNNMIDRFIRAFNDESLDWFRTNIKDRAAFPSLRAWLEQLIERSRPVGVSPRISGIGVSVSGQVPDLAQVKSVAGFLRQEQDTPIPFFTHFHRQDVDGTSLPPKIKNVMPPFSLAVLPALTGDIQSAGPVPDGDLYQPSPHFRPCRLS